MIKTILITGADKGIGFEMSRQLLSHGFRVIVTARNESKLDEAVGELKKEKGELLSLILDVSNQNSIHNAVESIAKFNIKIDVLINNAGVLSGNDNSLSEDDEEILMNAITVNSLGPLRVTKAFLPYLNDPSKVINMSSAGGSLSEPVAGWAPAYCVSKTLLNAVTRQLAFELYSKNISVNAVCPGWTKTDMGGRNAPQSVEKGAETAIWLITEASKHFTGKFFKDKMEIPW